MESHEEEKHTEGINDPGLHIEPEDPKEKRIAAIVLFIGVACAVLFIIISVNIISKYLSSGYRSFHAHFFDRIDDSRAEEEPVDKKAVSERKPRSKELELKVDEEADPEGKTGEDLVDFCDYYEFNKMLEHQNDHQINIDIWYKGAFYESDDKDVVIPVLNAMQTVKIGDVTEESFTSSDSLTFMFYDCDDKSVAAFYFYKDILSWQKYDMTGYFEVLDWGELGDLQFDFHDGEVTLNP
jgi:hypothetical protein